MPENTDSLANDVFHSSSRSPVQMCARETQAPGEGFERVVDGAPCCGSRTRRSPLRDRDGESRCAPVQVGHHLLALEIGEGPPGKDKAISGSCAQVKPHACNTHKRCLRSHPSFPPCVAGVAFPIVPRKGACCGLMPSPLAPKAGKWPSWTSVQHSSSPSASFSPPPPPSSSFSSSSLLLPLPLLLV